MEKEEKLCVTEIEKRTGKVIFRDWKNGEPIKEALIKNAENLNDSDCKRFCADLSPFGYHNVAYKWIKNPFGWGENNAN